MIYRYVVIRLSSSYGNLRAMPVGPMANAFAKIAGARTLTPAVLREIIHLGLYVVADGASADARALEASIGPGTALIPYSPGMEDELDPMMEAHLDNKAEHGT